MKEASFNVGARRGRGRSFAPVSWGIDLIHVLRAALRVGAGKPLLFALHTEKD